MRKNSHSNGMIVQLQEKIDSLFKHQVQLLSLSNTMNSQNQVEESTWLFLDLIWLPCHALCLIHNTLASCYPILIVWITLSLITGTLLQFKKKTSHFQEEALKNQVSSELLTYERAWWAILRLIETITESWNFRKGAFNNYVDQILPNFDRLPTLGGQLLFI